VIPFDVSTRFDHPDYASRKTVGTDVLGGIVGLRGRHVKVWGVNDAERQAARRVRSVRERNCTTGGVPKGVGV
jgi:hypothetical protein